MVNKMPTPKTKVGKMKDKRIEKFDVEQGLGEGEKSYWIYLHQGYEFSDGTTMLSFDSLSSAKKEMRLVRCVK